MAYTINVPKSNQYNNNSTKEDIGNGFQIIRNSGFIPPQEVDVSVKVCVVGDSAVGKSALLWRFTDQNYSPSFISTIGVDYKTINLEREGKTVKLQIWDTAGQDRFESIIASFFRGVHACMLVFALDDAESFDNVRNWVKKVHRHGSEEMSFVLIGNKLDLVERNPGLRQVPSEAGKNLAHSLGCDYIETSAKDDVNVAPSFAKLAEKAVARKLAGQQLENPNNLRNPNKRIRLGEAHQQQQNQQNRGGICAGRSCA